MLVSLSDVRTYLNATSTNMDAWLTEQIEIISDTVEAYCGRTLLSADSTQTFYKDEFDLDRNELLLANYPINTLTGIFEVDASTTMLNYRYHKPTGKIIPNEGYSFFDNSDSVIIYYNAGYPTTPTPIKSVVYSLVEERYNKKNQGIALGFGNDVQSISIPGTISISYDYSLQANERKSNMGMILGNYINILDNYRSERPIIGSVGREYLE
jgi:hypothetical protein